MEMLNRIINITLNLIDFKYQIKEFKDDSIKQEYINKINKTQEKFLCLVVDNTPPYEQYMLKEMLSFKDLYFLCMKFWDNDNNKKTEISRLWNLLYVPIVIGLTYIGIKIVISDK